MRRFCGAAAFALLCCGLADAQGGRILLTPARLHRLQRDRERNTPRWFNFEQRIKTVPDSPQRGFELALYSVVASDEERGREAVGWAVAHPCERRQTALILNWTRELVTDAERRQIASSSCSPTGTGPYQRLRDEYFWAVARGEDDDFKPEPPKLKDVPDPDELYALVEYLDAYRTRQARDLRIENADFFQRLPKLFLLTLPADALEHPSWQAHIVALALVSLDPNLESSQFLQSWGMENRFQITDGPGVGFEFLWADPYLPGLGYENLQPWLYMESEASLWARAGWEAKACWVHISPGHQESRNCTAGWDKATTRFGHLTLIPMAEQCYAAPPLKRDEQIILRTAKPNTRMIEISGKPHVVFSDAAGLRMWQASSTSICLDKNAARH